MKEEFRDIEGVETIVDDQVVWEWNDKEHDKRLEQVLEYAMKSGLKLNCKKCKFSDNHITYVGHFFSLDGLEPNPRHVEVTMKCVNKMHRTDPSCWIFDFVDMLEPNNKEALATFMGMITCPGMNSQIEDIASQCATCTQFRKAQPAEPLISHEIPDRPWSKIAKDLYHLNGPQYLILTDYYSKFPDGLSA